MQIKQRLLKRFMLALLSLASENLGCSAWAKPHLPDVHLEATSVNAIDPKLRLAGRCAVYKNFDRLTIPGEGQSAQASMHSDSITVRVQAPALIAPIAHCGRRVVSVIGGFKTATISLAAGAKVHTRQDNHALVIDVFDPVKGTSPAEALNAAAPLTGFSPANLGATRASIPGLPSKTNPALLKVEKASKDASAAVRGLTNGGVEAVGGSKSGNPVAVSFPQQSTSILSGADNTQLSSAPAAVSLLQEADVAGPAILFPVSNKTGAAAFVRGGQIHIIFDQSQAFDLSPLKDNPVFGGLTQAILPDGTDIRVHTQSPVQPHSSQYDGKWALSLAPISQSLSSVSVAGRGKAGSLSFNFQMPGRVVVIDDDVTGGRLLIGTDRKGGQGLAGRHLSPDLAILASSQGLVVQPASDRVVLHTTREGFDISNPDRSLLAVVWPEPTRGAWPDGHVMTRMFDFPDSGAGGQARRLAQALQDAARLPKTARYAARLRVAQAMLAEGLDLEAGSVVSVAVTDEPRHRGDTMAVGLSAIAAWLSGEAGGRQPLSSLEGFGQLRGNDEATMWRALLWPDQPDTARQAAALATTWPLILRYPQNLRRFMLRPVAALLKAGGQDKAWAAFLSSFPDASLDSSRASYLQSLGKNDESAALLAQVEQRPDRLDRAEARRSAVEQQLKAGQLTPAEAAGKLDNLLFAWRGDSREMRLRQRVAELHAQAGAWRKALAELTDAEAIFPEWHAAIRQAQTDIIDNLLHGKQAEQLGALDLVYLAQQATKLSAEIDQGRFAPLLAEKLMALDLPTQAEPIIRDLFLHAREAHAKAEIGLQLAELQFSRGDISAALAVLDISDDPGLSSVVASSRVLLRARLLASSGKSADALATLASQPGPKAREAEATIMETHRDWRGAAGALSRLANDHEFTALPDMSQQEVIVRLARNLSEAGDAAALRQLRKAYGPRFLSGPNAALFAVLTADPVQTTADLPRSAREIEVMHALPTSLGHPAS